MKTFTRSIATFALALFGMTSFAQVDLQVTSVTVANVAGSVPFEYTTPVLMRFTNLGPDPVPAGTTYDLTVLTGTNVALGPLTSDPIAAPLAVGDTVGYIISFYDFTEPHGNLEEVCARVYANTLVDGDSSNNTDCQNFQIDTNLTNDVAVIDVTLVTPLFEDINNFDIDDNALTPDPITEFSFRFANVGDVAIFNGDWNFEASLGTTTSNFIYTPGENLFAGDTNLLELGANINFNMAIPKVKGLYEFCVTVLDPDSRSSNDKDCVEFNIKNTLLGINDLNGNGLNLMFTNSFIGLTNYSLANIESQIIDMNGRIVMNVKNVDQPQIDITSLPAGVYVINCVDTKTGESISEKFSKI